MDSGESGSGMGVPPPAYHSKASYTSLPQSDPYCEGHSDPYYGGGGQFGTGYPAPGTKFPMSNYPPHSGSYAPAPPIMQHSSTNTTVSTYYGDTMTYIVTVLAIMHGSYMVSLWDVESHIMHNSIYSIVQSCSSGEIQFTTSHCVALYDYRTQSRSNKCMDTGMEIALYYNSLPLSPYMHACMIHTSDPLSMHACIWTLCRMLLW